MEFTGKSSLPIRVMRMMLCILGVVALSPMADALNILKMVPMSDGTKLATDIWLPEEGEAEAWPVILVRSVYGRKLDQERYLKAGYAVVVQDVRGRGDSEGVDNMMQADGWRQGQQDGADTVAWIKEQAWCDGHVASVGSSALGMTQALLGPATDQLNAQVIEAAAGDFHPQVAYQGGVFRKSMAEGWLTAQKLPHVLVDWKQHPQFDRYWTYYDADSRAASVTAPGLFVAGWYDIFNNGTIDNFAARQYEGGPGARGNQRLIIKWSSHGSDDWTDMKLQENRFDVQISKERQEFLDYWCKGQKNGAMDKPMVTYYVMGDDRYTTAPGMHWRGTDQWPPIDAEEEHYYLSGDTLHSETPEANEATRGYDYNPADPFPTLGGQNLVIPAGSYDQRKVNKGRDDLLTFATEPLEQPLEVTGRTKLILYVSTDAPDTDFTAKLVDIYPEGDEREMLIADNIQRVKYRDKTGLAMPLLESADQVVRLEIDLGWMSWIFNEGHRIGVQVSSSNYPRFEKNPNNGQDFPGGQLPEQVARNVVHMGTAYPSALVLPVRNSALDHDGDGIPTIEEWTKHYTDPDKADSDEDGKSDGEEIEAETDPLKK